VNGQPNEQNGYYDQDMAANLIAMIGDVSGYEIVTVSFWYWAVTGSSSLEDHLSIWYFSGGLWLQGWSQTSVSSGGWQQISMAIPNSSTAIGFVFHSDPTVGSGPYEGAYLDDIAVTGTDSIPPQSSVLSFPPYSASRAISVEFSASDNPGGSGLDSVALYFRVNGGQWFPYPGTFISSPIPFVAPSDGSLDFYTTATDRSGNAEAAPAVPDASIVVDTQAPSLAVTQPAASQWIGSTTVGIAWSASDDGSGIGRFTVALDGGAEIEVGISRSYTFNGVSEGSHSVTVLAFDRAGMRAEVSAGFGVDVTDPTVSITSPGPGEDVVQSDVLVSWTGSDSGSGIDHYEVRLDAGSFVPVTSELTHTYQGVPDGLHSVTVKAVDVAGNMREETVTFRVNTNWATGGGPYGWLPLSALFLAIVLVISLAAFLWRRRGRRTAVPPPSRQGGGNLGNE